MIIDQIVEEAKKEGLDKLISGEWLMAKILEIRGELIQMGRQGITIQLPVDVSQEQRQRIEKIIEDVKKKNNSDIDVQIEQMLAVGDKFPNFGQINKVLQQGTGTLAAQQGQVLLVDAWATWCGPCQRPMAHNQEMIEKNKQWGNKVRIVAVSLDQDIQQVKKRVQQKGWKSIEHLALKGWDQNHKFVKNFSITGIPFICLVNTKGQIEFTGHPSKINLEQKINELLKGQNKQIKKQQVIQKKAKITNEQILKIRDVAGNENVFKQQFSKLHFISTKVILRTKVVSGQISNSADITVYINQQDKQVLDQYQKLIPSKGVNFIKKIVQTAQVPKVPEQCHQCKKKLNYPLYWCKWSKDENDFRCTECVEKKKSEKQFAYDQNSILLLVQKKTIPSAALGSNIQPAVNVQQLDSHSFGCNGCGGCPQSVGIARYICLGCRTEPNHRGDYIDICQPCMIKVRQKDEEMLKSLQSDGHKYEHPLLRILYNVKGYYQY